MNTNEEYLVQRLAEANATIEALISGQIDAVIDSKSGTPVLLAKAREALKSSEKREAELDRFYTLSLDMLGIAGLAGGETCALPFRDGGRACTDRTQCTGLCLAPDGAAEGGKPGAENPVVGHCQAYNYPYGCHATVDHGQLMGELCVD